MKKTSLRYWFKMSLILVVASFFVVSCKSKKPTITEETNTKDSIFNSVATDTKTEISKAIEDSISKFIPVTKTGVKDCDSICDEKITDLLQQLNFSKTSGNNSYKLLYDKHKRLLSFVAKQEQTINQLKTKKEVKERHFLKTKTITITKDVPKPVNRFGFLDLMGVLFLLFLGWRFSKIFI